MISKQEIFNKYPDNIIDIYFSKGLLFNWYEEYFDIAWQYPSYAWSL